MTGWGLALVCVRVSCLTHTHTHAHTSHYSSMSCSCWVKLNASSCLPLGHPKDVNEADSDLCPWMLPPLLPACLPSLFSLSRPCALPNFTPFSLVSAFFSFPYFQFGCFSLSLVGTCNAVTFIPRNRWMIWQFSLRLNPLSVFMKPAISFIYPTVLFSCLISSVELKKKIYIFYYAALFTHLYATTPAVCQNGTGYALRQPQLRQ